MADENSGSGQSAGDQQELKGEGEGSGLQAAPSVTSGVDSKMFRAGKRTYFFDVKKDRRGVIYLVVTESRYMGETGERMRNSVVVYPEDAADFEKYLTEALKSLKKV